MMIVSPFGRLAGQSVKEGRLPYLLLERISQFDDGSLVGQLGWHLSLSFTGIWFLYLLVFDLESFMLDQFGGAVGSISSHPRDFSLAVSAELLVAKACSRIFKLSL